LNPEIYKNDNKNDWLSKKEFKFKNRKGENIEKIGYPGFLYGVFSIKKVNDNLTSINNLLCNY
jgi:hypothetical protein